MENSLGQDILDISKYAGGKILFYVAGIIQVVMLFYVANTVIRNFSYTIKTIYFNKTPILFIASFMVIACSIACKHGIKPISKVCLYILPLAYIGLILLLLAPSKDFEIQRLFPALGYGIKETFVSGLFNLFAVSGLGYVFLLPPLLKNSNEISNISKIALYISSFFLLLGIICVQLVFSLNMNSNENMTLYLLTMIVHHENLIHLINILFMIIWILSILSYISITLFFILYVIKKMYKSANLLAVNIVLSLSLIALSALFQNNPQIFSTTKAIMQSSILCFVFILEPIILILAYIKKRLKERNNYEEKL